MRKRKIEEKRQKCETVIEKNENPNLIENLTSCDWEEISPEDDSLLYYFKEISSYKLLNADEEKELSKKILEGDKVALERLISCNLRLVVKIARKFVCHEYPLIDIIQDGNMGLMKAAQKFDFRKNVRFATYAQWWIKQTIQRCLYLRKRIVRIPHRKAEKIRMIKNLIDAFYQEFDRYPTVGELSDHVGISREDIDNMLLVSGNIISIDEHINENSLSNNYLSNDEKYLPENFAVEQSVRSMTEEMLAVLYPREKKIIECRYGLNDGKKITLKSMGDLFGVSPENVRQIEKKALKKMQADFPYAKEFITQ